MIIFIIIISYIIDKPALTGDELIDGAESLDRLTGSSVTLEYNCHPMFVAHDLYGQRITAKIIHPLALAFYCYKYDHGVHVFTTGIRKRREKKVSGTNEQKLDTCVNALNQVSTDTTKPLCVMHAGQERQSSKSILTAVVFNSWMNCLPSPSTVVGASRVGPYGGKRCDTTGRRGTRGKAIKVERRSR